MSDLALETDGLVRSFGPLVAVVAAIWGLGALGAEGPSHVIDVMIDEMKSAFGQVGAFHPQEARTVVIRHPGAMQF